jgi:hypothetical protein
MLLIILMLLILLLLLILMLHLPHPHLDPMLLYSWSHVIFYIVCIYSIFSVTVWLELANRACAAPVAPAAFALRPCIMGIEALLGLDTVEGRQFGLLSTRRAWILIRSSGFEIIFVKALLHLRKDQFLQEPVLSLQALLLVLPLQMPILFLGWDMLPGALELLELLVVLEVVVLEVEPFLAVLQVLILEQLLGTDLRSASSPPWVG